MAEITKSYEPAEVERKWYAAWQKAGAFAGRVVEGLEPYCVVIPPPNVTGVLHIGHVLNNTLQDVLVRRARLQGKAAVWIPGTDHASIATHAVVERELRQKESKTRWQLGREEFLRRTKAWQEKHGGIILGQLKALGCSCDWDRTVFTMDPDYNRSVLTAFVELFRRRRIYRGKRMVNWCPATLTALSDEEVVMKPVNGTLYHVRYEMADRPGQFIQVATTRPETIPGDTAIAVHPDDLRYAGFVGRSVWRPLNRARIPIVADSAVDREFGSGALKITPAHDKLDFEIGRRHQLPVVDVLEANGVLNQFAGPELAGLDRFDGREKAVELLRAAGALVNEEAYSNNVGYSERADVPIEPRLTWQWWMRYPKVDEAKAAVESGAIRFHPERWSKVYLHWLNNIQDWCISRQLWWGQRIPVWYRKGVDRDSLDPTELDDPAKVHVSIDGPGDPENWEQEDDVLDTWASSWLWPFGTLGWPDAEAERRRGFDFFYPTAALVTAPEIIFFWVARMIMAGLEFARPGQPLERRIPFRDVYFTGIVRDQLGRKMSKSLGNSPDPLDLIARYGADGLRFGIVSIAPLGQDIRFQDERIEAGKNFCNKLWNACRFRLRAGEGETDSSSLASIVARFDPSKFASEDHGILHRLVSATAEAERCLGQFEFSAAIQALYGFFWNDFCDWYVEVSKVKLQSPATKANCLAIQDFTIRQVLLLLHPFIPFITEELWHELGFGGPQALLMRDGRLPFAAELTGAMPIEIDPLAVKKDDAFKEFVSQVLQLKAAHGLAGRRDIDAFGELRPAKMPFELDLTEMSKYFRLAGLKSFKSSAIPHGLPVIVTPFGPVGLAAGQGVIADLENERLTKEIGEIDRHIAGTKARLSNPGFVGRAPAEVIEGARNQLSGLEAKRAELEKRLNPSPR